MAGAGRTIPEQKVGERIRRLLAAPDARPLNVKPPRGPTGVALIELAALRLEPEPQVVRAHDLRGRVRDAVDVFVAP